MKLNRLSMLTWNRVRVNETYLELPETVTKALSDFSDAAEVGGGGLDIRSGGVSQEALAMNRKYCTEYMTLEAKEGEVSKQYRVEHLMDGERSVLLDRKDIIAEKNSKLSVILDYWNEEETFCDSFRNTVIKILAREGSEVTLFYLSRNDAKNLALVSLEADILKNAKVHLVQAEVGSRRSFFHYEANLLEENATAEVDSIYFTDRDRELELFYQLNHFGKKTISRISVHGALKDSARKMFKGTIDFKSGCSEAKGSEEEFATLLDDGVRNIAVPILLCQEDDVEGVHAASAGKIDEDLLFYLMSRGLDSHQAKKVIIESQLTPTLDLFPDKEWKEKIWERIERAI